jgi:hypothetical protein
MHTPEPKHEDSRGEVALTRGPEPVIAGASQSAVKT